MTLPDTRQVINLTLSTIMISFLNIFLNFEQVLKFYEIFLKFWVNDAISESILYSITHLAVARHELSCAARNLDGYLRLIYRALEFIILAFFGMTRVTVMTLALSWDNLQIILDLPLFELGMTLALIFQIWISESLWMSHTVSVSNMIMTMLSIIFVPIIWPSFENRLVKWNGTCRPF